MSRIKSKTTGLTATYKRKNLDGLDSIKPIVDQAWRAFWRRRGIHKPPPVSSIHVGGFILPNEELPNWDSHRFRNNDTTRTFIER